MISKIKNKEGQIDIDIEGVDGEISKILKLGLNLNHVELNQLAMGYAYDLHKKDPKDKELLLILEDLINDELVLLDGEIGEETKPLLKGVDEMYEKMVKYVQVIDNGPTVYDSDPKYGVSLGIDKIVFVDPVHKKIRYDYKRVQEMLIDEEKTEIELNEIIDKSAATTKLEYTILDDKRFDKNSTSAYNDFVEIEQWANFRALSRHIDLNAVDIYKNSSERIRLKYGTNTFVWTGVLSLKVIPPKVIRAQRWIAPALDLAVGTLPFLTILTTAVRNYSDGITKTKYDTYYYFIMIDLETGKSIYEKTEECDRPDSKGNVGLWIYDLIHQVNKK